MTDTTPIERWLEAYQAAWTSSSGIAELFTHDARYFTAPYRTPLVGVEAIERWWIEQGEADIRWTFEYEVVAANGPLHVVRGTTTYPDAGSNGGAQVYHNLWLVTLAADGRASEFVEYWMLAE